MLSFVSEYENRNLCEALTESESISCSSFCPAVKCKLTADSAGWMSEDTHRHGRAPKTWTHWDTHMAECKQPHSINTHELSESIHSSWPICNVSVVSSFFTDCGTSVIQWTPMLSNKHCNNGQSPWKCGAMQSLVVRHERRTFQVSGGRK